MKKIFTLTVLSIIIITSTKAQVSYGVQAGVSIANWKGNAMQSLNDIVDLSNGFIGTKSRTGFHIGGYASIPLTETISFEPGLQYSQKGYAMQGDLKIDALKFLGVNASAKVEANYFDMPLLVKAEVAKGLSIYAGPQISYLAKTSLHINTSVLGISLLNKRLDFCLSSTALLLEETSTLLKKKVETFTAIAWLPKRKLQLFFRHNSINSMLTEASAVKTIFFT